MQIRNDHDKTTIRARIRVAVWPDGSWTAYGDQTKNVERTFAEIIDAAPGGESYHWIECDLPLPTTIEAEVVNHG